VIVNQSQRLDAIIASVSQIETLQKIELPAELAEPKSRLKLLKANHYNWESKKFRKIFAMRFSTKLPKLQQINCILYPRENYPLPIFIFFMLITKRKVIAHLNINCPFDSSEYKNVWVQPLKQRLNKFSEFECADRYPEWMKKYRNSSTIYGMFLHDRLDDLSNCCFDYLDYYMNTVRGSEPETNREKLIQIKKFQEGFIQDIRTQDKAQSMIAKMIGAKTARRIFYEVTT